VKRGSLAVILLIVFIDLLGFGILIPLLPLYAEKYRPTPLAFGLLLSSFSLMQFFFAPLLGRLSDRIGRRPVLVISLAGSAAGYLLFGLARSLAVLFAARIIDGISGANIATAQAYVADVTDRSTRTRAMGSIGAAFGLGFVFGPAIGGFALRGGESAPGFVAAGLSTLALVLTIVLLPEPPARSAEGSLLARRSFAPTKFARTMRQPAIATILIVFFLVTFAFSNFEATFSQFLHGRLALAPSHVAFVFVYVGVLIVAVQGGLIRFLASRARDATLAAGGIALLTAGLAAMPLAASVRSTLELLVPLTVGIGIINPSLSSLISKLASEEERGAVLGLFQSMSSLGRIAGPIWGEFTFARFGPAGPQWTGAAVAACAGGLSLAIWKRQ
jgi:DHA1 family tetracycline resistance protein-like MFS transporter